MKVILTEKVTHLGNIGEIVNVSQGHARNYLIPNRLAVLADEGNKKLLEDQQRRLAKKIDAEKAVAMETKKQLEGLTIELVRKVGGSGKLFGTVTNIELSRELKKKDIEVERRIIVIENPIKTLGNFDVKVKLFQDVEAVFKVNITMDPKQAEELKAKEAVAKKKKEEEKAKAKEEKAKDAKDAPKKEAADAEEAEVVKESKGDDATKKGPKAKKEKKEKKK